METFTIRMDRCDSDIAADCMAVVVNADHLGGRAVAINEIRIVPKAINDDVGNLTGNQGIVSLDRITDVSGGTAIDPVKYDTAASGLPSQIKFYAMPTSVTTSGTIRRFGDAISTYTVAKAIPFQAMIRAPNVVDSNDHSGRTSESQDVWHADGVTETEPIVVREGEGIALVRRAFGLPQAMHLAVTARVLSGVIPSGRVYKWLEGDVGTADEIGQASIALFNGVGSNTTLQIYIVGWPSLGEENPPMYRLAKVTLPFDTRFPLGEAVTVVKHDTATTGSLISVVSGYRGPMRIYPDTNGLYANYYDYQMNTGGASVTWGTTLGVQRAGLIRAWLGGSSPNIRTTTTTLNMIPEVLQQGGGYEIWPGTRRGVEGVYDLPIILRAQEGLAIFGGWKGNIETSELAFLDIEFEGYIIDTTDTLNYPAEPDVKVGVDYGLYNELEGTYSPAGGNTYSRGRVVNT